MNGYINGASRHLAGSSRVSYEVVVHNLNKIEFPRYIDWKSSTNKERFDILFDLPKMISLNGNERIKALVNDSTLASDTNTATLIVETPTTLRWSNLPGILTTGGLLRLKLNNFATPSLVHLPTKITQFMGYIHFTIFKHNTGSMWMSFVGTLKFMP